MVLKTRTHAVTSAAIKPVADSRLTSCSDAPPVPSRRQTARQNRGSAPGHCPTLPAVARPSFESTSSERTGAGRSLALRPLNPHEYWLRAAGLPLTRLTVGLSSESLIDRLSGTTVDTTESETFYDREIMQNRPLESPRVACRSHCSQVQSHRKSHRI